MIGVLMLSITLGISYKRKYPREEVLLTTKEKLNTARQSIIALIMPVFVVGAVVFGIATPTESAGLGVLYAFLIGAFIIRDLKFKVIPPLMRDSICTSANVMVIIALSKLYIWILALERVPQTVAMFVSGLDIPSFIILLLIDLIILATGTFVDVSPAILLLTPVFLPAMEVLGVSRIQFGVILISGLAVGLVTPPVGMCLNVASAISKLSIGRIFLGAMPFLLANIITLVLITFIPELCLWLPAVFFD
jgi:tripartite ATP-independent transporter DctM subunit